MSETPTNSVYERAQNFLKSTHNDYNPNEGNLADKVKATQYLKQLRDNETITRGPETITAQRELISAMESGVIINPTNYLDDAEYVSGKARIKFGGDLEYNQFQSDKNDGAQDGFYKRDGKGHNREDVVLFPQSGTSTGNESKETLLSSGSSAAQYGMRKISDGTIYEGEYDQSTGNLINGSITKSNGTRTEYENGEVKELPATPTPTPVPTATPAPTPAAKPNTDTVPNNKQEEGNWFSRGWDGFKSIFSSGSEKVQAVSSTVAATVSSGVDRTTNTDKVDQKKIDSEISSIKDRLKATKFTINGNSVPGLDPEKLVITQIENGKYKIDSEKYGLSVLGNILKEPLVIDNKGNLISKELTISKSLLIPGVKLFMNDSDKTLLDSLKDKDTYTLTQNTQNSTINIEKKNS